MKRKIVNEMLTGLVAATMLVSTLSPVQVYAGSLVDGIKKTVATQNNEGIHRESLVGNFYGLEFLKDKNDENSRYDISSWNPSDPNSGLDYFGDGMYKKTYYFKELQQDLELQDGGYKIAQDGSWDISYGKNGGNIPTIIPKGSTSFTVLVDTVTGRVYDSVNNKKELNEILETGKIDREKQKEQEQKEEEQKKKEPTDEEKKAGRPIFVPGTFPGKSWDPASNQMTYKGNGLYEYTFKNVPAGNYQYKISVDGSWDENYGVDGKRDGGNNEITVSKPTDVTVYYNDYTHKMVTNLNYIFADIDLKGKGIPENVKLKDDGLTGIYSAKIKLPAGKYDDIKAYFNGKEFKYSEFVLNKEKEVTFYFDPVTEIYYDDASDKELETKNIFYNTKNKKYKSVYGAVATNEKVTFSIDTGSDATEVKMVVNGTTKKNLSMKEVKNQDNGDKANNKNNNENDSKSNSENNKVKTWSITTSFENIGENQYYFVISNGSSVKVYGDDDGYYGSGKVSDLTNIKPYDLVVYKEGYKTPDWMKNATIYQIFPDRFYNGDTTNDEAQKSARGSQNYEFIQNWNELPENPEQEAVLSKEEYEKHGAHYGDGIWNNEIYGGDLKGITQKIKYLKGLGVNVIYINPIFSSISSHRYDTSDYKKIDPILGTQGDFDELVKVAKKNGMHIILDGVFNHVSDDSVYFDRYYKYLKKGSKTVGAYPYWAHVYDLMHEKNMKKEEAIKETEKFFGEKYGVTDFSYAQWFEIYEGSTLKDEKGEDVKDTIGARAGKPVYGYEGWWGYDSMPVIKATNGSEYQSGNWGQEIIGNEKGDSVTQYWLKKGSSGWRLDVANEVSDETWQNFRKSVKALNSDNVIVGEIWDDATKYLMGDMYDSVMNYVFRDAVLAYAKGGSVDEMNKKLEKIRERYPKEAYYAMMNLVGSHDTARLLSYLDGIDDDRKQKEEDKAFPTYEKTSDLAKRRQYLVAFLQFTYPGAPTIYYGDEIGMVGADDPDDRRCFTWGQGNKELVEWYAKLGAIRKNSKALRTGDMDILDVLENGEVLGIANEDKIQGKIDQACGTSSSGEIDQACGTSSSGEIDPANDISSSSNILGFVRRDKSEGTNIVFANNGEQDQKIVIDLSKLNLSKKELSTKKLYDLVSGKKIKVVKGKAVVNVKALSGVILSTEKKTVKFDKKALKSAYDEKASKAEDKKNHMQEEKARKQKEKEERIKKEQAEKARKQKEKEERTKKEQAEKARKQKEKEERAKKR